jgi:hypothetical protein
MAFTDEDKEWHNSILIMITKMLNMKMKPVIVYNRELFDSYEPKSIFNVNEIWGECIDDTGLIWLNGGLHNKPKTLTLNTIIHECLHIKNPDWSEDRVRDTADNIIPIQ